jgi:hypothetical protein
MHTTRRTFLGLVGVASGWRDAVGALATPSEDRNPVTEGDKVGPPPMLPPLPPRPYPPRRQYLFTDGTIRDGGGGFAYGLWLHWMWCAGVVRSIPYGLDIQTDEQKLWLLGRRSFAPRFDGDLMAFVRRATSRPHQPSWRGRIKQQFPPMTTTDGGRLVPDMFD